MTRRISLQSVNNFRDIGGCETIDGRTVKHGNIFRSGHLANIDTKGLKDLELINLKYICDLRSTEERYKQPNKTSAFYQLIEMPIDPGNREDFFRWLTKKGITKNDMLSSMQTIYKDLVISHSIIYKKILNMLLEVNNAAFLIHCSLGKDRTGITTALILAALGASKEKIMEDYLLSNNSLPNHNQLTQIKETYNIHKDLSMETLMILLSVREEYLHAAFDTIDFEFGSLNEYLEIQLGLTPEKLKFLRKKYTL